MTPGPNPRFGGAAFGWALLAGAAAVIDFTAGGQALAPAPLLWAAGLGLAAGAASGALLWLLFLLAYRLPRGAAAGLWFVLGAALAGSLASALGAPARLGGKDHDLAVLALAASGLLGLALFAVGLAVQPRPGRPRGWLARRATAARAAASAVFVSVAAAATYIDRTVEVDTYAAAHLALRCAALGALWLVLLAWRRRPARPFGRRRRAALLAAAALALAPFVTLRPAHRAALHALFERPYTALPLRLLRPLGDPDLDGYSALLGGGDCAPLDGRVHPGAREVPQNGVDDNCRRGDAAAAPPPPAGEDAAPTPPGRAPASAVLITVDTVVASRTSLYGAARRTTPELEKWARGGATFERAYTSGGWTSLAISSMLRGVYPRRLRWTRVFETKRLRLVRAADLDAVPASDPVRIMFGLPLEDPRPPLPVLLGRRGLRAAAVVDDGQSEFLDPDLGTARGFDTFVDLDRRKRPRAGDDKVTTDAALEVLRDIPVAEPFFLWVHYFGPHAPNTEHKGFEKFGPRQEDGYDHELLYFDHHVARLLGAIDQRARRLPVAVILAADHGEVFYGRGRSHGSDLREQLVRVPLVVRGPGVTPGRYDGVASAVDVAPTLLAMTGTPAPPGLDGADLRRVAAGDPALAGRILLAETWRFSGGGRLDRDYVAAFDGTHRLTWNLVDEDQELTREGAPGDNLVDTVDAGALRRRLEDYLEANGAVDMND